MVDDAAELGVPRNAFLVMEFPLALPMDVIERDFKRLLTSHHKGRRGVRNDSNSTALYPIVGHIDFGALDKRLACFKLKKHKSELTMWQIANELRLLPEHRLKNNGSESKAEITNKKQNLASTANRAISEAKLIISGVESGKFPCMK